MKVLLSPIITSQRIYYTFDDDAVMVTHSGVTERYDFGGLPDGSLIIYDEFGNYAIESDMSVAPFTKVVKEGGELFLTLRYFISEDAPDSLKFPEWMDAEELDVLSPEEEAEPVEIEFGWLSAEDEAEAERQKRQAEENAQKRNKAMQVLTEKIASEYLSSDEVTDADKALFTSLYDEWKPGDDLDVGEKRTYDGVVYEVIQAHKAQGNWRPPEVPALFRVVYQTEATDPETGEEVEVIPDFVQPTGGHDAYKKGDRVMFEGKPYESLLANNVWSPNSYPQGWKEL